MIALLGFAAALWIPFWIFGLERVVQNRWIWLTYETTHKIRLAGLLASIPIALASPFLLPGS
jgi:hypothetical protein